MRGSKAKAIRNFIKGNGKDATERDYQEWQPPVYTNKIGKVTLPRFMKSRKGVPCRLDPSCGRAVYQKIKAQLKGVQ